MIEWRNLWQLRHIKTVLKPYENGWKILQEHSKEGLGVSPFTEFKTVKLILMKKCCKTWNMKILWTSLRKLSYTINSRIWKRCRLRDWARCHSADPFWFMSTAHKKSRPTPITENSDQYHVTCPDYCIEYALSVMILIQNKPSGCLCSLELRTNVDNSLSHQTYK